MKYMISIFQCLLWISLSSFSQQPNIIYIMTDDMGYADLSCYGSKIKTPHIDKLASEGIKFLQAYAAAPVCTPTRAAFMTGRFPAHTEVGLKEPLTADPKDSTVGLTSKDMSIATRLKFAGYHTSLVGKWHLGFTPAYSPGKNGFDYFFGMHSGAADYKSHKGNSRKHDLYENEKPVYIDGYLTDLFTRRAIEIIKQPHSKPFFLALMYNAPHWPWQGPNDDAYHDTLEFTKGGSSEIYAAMLKSMDDGIGQILQTLDDEKLAANTIIIFTNDNGGERFSDNGEFANRKMSLWEGGIRVPAIVRWPGKIKPGTSTNQPAITMDWTTTILSIAGTKLNTDIPLDGIDLMPVLTGEKNEIDRTFYWRIYQRTKQKAIRKGNWKYLQVENEEFLFDLSNDHREKTNLKDLHPEILKSLKMEYVNWEKKVRQPLPL